MRMSGEEIVTWFGIAAIVVFLIALDAKSRMTWLGVVLGAAALGLALYYGAELPRVAWGRGYR